jgi:hypothetical protein
MSGKGFYDWTAYANAYAAARPENFIPINTVEAHSDNEEFTGQIFPIDILEHPPLSAEIQVIKANAYSVLSGDAKQIINAILSDELETAEKKIVSKRRVIRYFQKLIGKSRTEEAIKEIKWFINIAME